MKLSDYEYDLPSSAIALHPPEKRGSSRLLVIDRGGGQLKDSLYTHLDDFLKPGDVLVLNNTRVLPARLMTTTDNGDERELLVLEKHDQQADPNVGLVMYRRSLRPGQTLHINREKIVIEEIFNNGTARVRADVPLYELAEHEGTVPLPPYMHRGEEAGDRERYQTVFAKENGSVAAPTASLNLTDELLARVKKKGIEVVELTLHVGLGTFMPIRSDDITEHTMHEEYFEVPVAAAEAIHTAKQEGRRVIAVGTTVTRTLEFAAEQLFREAQATHGEADIFIYPGYDFKIVDGMLTNFHAPRSTVLMMAAAFVGWENLKAGYEHALKEHYAFLSYGDSTLLI